MPQVSKYPLRQSIKDDIIDSLWWLIGHLNQKDDVNKFLSDFLTETEKLMLAKRLAIALMLEKGFSYDVIKDTLKVSTSTITVISNWLHKGGDGYRIAIRKLAEKEQMEKIGKEVGNFFNIVTKGKRVFPRK